MAKRWADATQTISRGSTTSTWRGLMSVRSQFTNTTSSSIRRLFQASLSWTSERFTIRNLMQTKFPRWGAKHKDLKRFSAYGGTPSDLRATAANRVLKYRGALLQNGDGDATTYSFSQPVEQVDVFISHNWSVPRCSKFMVLAMTFNNRKTWLIVMSILTVVFILTSAGHLPLIQVRDIVGEEQAHGVVATFLSTPLFLICLFFSQELAGLFRIRGPMCFLDKTCIHQTDEDAKRRGVQNLGAFLFHSNSMYVVFGPEYLKKLWTVYEIATFLTLNPAGQLKVTPLFQPKFIILASTDLWLLSCLELIRMAFFVKVLIAFVFTVAMFVMCRQWSRVRSAVAADILNFDIRNATCFDENDRTFVESNVETAMKGEGLVSTDMPKETVLDAFNDLVRTELPARVICKFGRAGLPLRHLAVIALASYSQALDEFAGVLHTRGCSLRAITYFVLKLSGAVASVNALGLMMLLSRCCLSRGRSTAVLLCVIAVFETFAIPLTTLLPLLLGKGDDDDDVFAALVTVCFTSHCVVCYAIFKPLPSSEFSVNRQYRGAPIDAEPTASIVSSTQGDVELDHSSFTGVIPENA